MGIPGLLCRRRPAWFLESVMALNLTNMVKAPLYNFEVFMVRNRSLNAVENSRKRMAYVQASNADDAKREAKKIHPQFHPESARRV